ncbi:zinc finger protein ZOP1 isoform X1 [Nymphaea colorata]|nr:zinc finger protein ZOP1 isoform X1 [Nymphaea colorata]
MTEYWVSQGNKWCDFCKIYIANNPLSIRTHELGQRHKDNVAKRLSAMRKENAAKEKEKKDAERALEHIEAKAKQSYQKDLASFQGARRETELKTAPPGDDWQYDSSSGYYFNQASGYYFDTDSGLYYSDNIGKWMTQEEASTLNNAPRSDCAGATCSKAKDGCERIAFSAVKTLVTYSETEHSQSQGSPAPRPVLKSAACARSIKGVPSSIAVTKRKRDEKPKAVSEEEAAALKARDAARKRVEEREKSLLGLYRSY